MVWPRPGEVHVWAAQLDRIDPHAAWIQALTEDERNRAAAFHFEHDKRRFERRRCLLRLLLSRYLAVEPGGVRLCYGPQGKPELAHSSGLHFNLSHSDGHALFAFATRELGVDLERIRGDRDVDSIGRIVFAPGERQHLEMLPLEKRVHAFFRCWTRKEAYIKARGKGLSIALDSFEVSLAPDGQTNLITEAAHWILSDVPAFPRFAACVAMTEPCGIPELRRIACDSGIIGS